MQTNKIYCRESIEFMKSLPSKSVGSVITDPPYNAKDIGPHHKKYPGKMCLPLKEYKKFCRDWFKEARRIAKTVVFTPGIANVCYYPQPDWIFCWYKPAALSYNRFGGFNFWEPIMVYGKASRRIEKDWVYCLTLNMGVGPERGHPCPKPPKLMLWIVNRFSKEEETVLDPFCGAGTTLLACEKLNRKWIGVDQVEKYCKISRKRIRTERRQLKLF